MDSWDRWVCRICEYIYDPCIGDPKQGVEAGTSFHELPKDWICPDCSAGKDNFKVSYLYTEELY